MNLFHNIDKCLFHVPEVEFEGFQVVKQRKQISQKKVKVIVNWPAPRNVKEVQTFIGFTNFYGRCIKAFSSLTLLTSGTNFLRPNATCRGLEYYLTDALAPCARSPMSSCRPMFYHSIFLFNLKTIWVPRRHFSHLPWPDAHQPLLSRGEYRPT